MVIFSQTLSDPEHTRVLKEARRCAMGLHMSSDRYPVGETVVPSSHPNWNYNDPAHIWKKRSFSNLCEARTERSPTKSNQLCPGLSNNSGAQQELHCLSGKAKRGPPKFTNLDLDSYKGQVILKDKFLSQCASDIRINLQQLQQQDPAASLEEMD